MVNQVKLKLHVFFILLHASSYNLHFFFLQLSQDNSVFESSGLTLNPTLAT